MKKQKTKSDQRSPSARSSRPTKAASKAASLQPRAPVAELTPVPDVTPVDAASDAPPSEQRRKELPEEAVPPSEPTSSVRRIDAAAAAKYQHVYAAARVTGTDGQIQLDEQRFAQSLAELAVDPLTGQDLYSLALMAAADGDTSLFEHDVLMELRAT
jgi:hypothetical protein